MKLMATVKGSSRVLLECISPGEFSDFVRDQLEEKLEPMLSRVIAATSALSEELTK